MDNTDNTIHFSDDEDDVDQLGQDGKSLCCKSYASTFTAVDKGCSMLKELCAKCNGKENDELLAALEEDGQDESSSDQFGSDPKENAKGSDSEEPKTSSVAPSEKVSPESSASSTTAEVSASVDNITKDGEGEDDKEEKEDVDFNSLAFTQCFFGKETSFSLKVGGSEQMFARKVFQHGDHRCFLDLEQLSKLPKLLNYFVLSAVAHAKKVYLAMCYVEHKVTKKRYLVLAILRSKCQKIRYDYVLVDEEDDNCVSILAGITKMDAYNFLPDVEVDLEPAKDMLAAFLCNPKNRLALIEGHPNKDEYGSLIADGDFDPLQQGMGGMSSRKRARKTTSFYGDGDKKQLKPKGRVVVKKQGLRGSSKTKKARKETPTIEELDDDDGEGAEDSEEEEAKSKALPPVPPAASTGKGGRPSHKEVELQKQLEAMREAAAEEKRARVELEAKLNALMQQQPQRNVSPGTPVFSGSPVVQTPSTGSTGGVVLSSGSSSGALCSDVAVRYQQLAAYGEQIAQVNELARVSRENMTLRAALWGSSSSPQGGSNGG